MRNPPKYVLGGDAHKNFFHFLLIRVGTILLLRGELMGNWTDQRKREKVDLDPRKERAIKKTTMEKREEGEATEQRKTY